MQTVRELLLVHRQSSALLMATALKKSPLKRQRKEFQLLPKRHFEEVSSSEEQFSPPPSGHFPTYRTASRQELGETLGENFRTDPGHCVSPVQKAMVMCFKILCYSAELCGLLMTDTMAKQTFSWYCIHCLQ